MRILIIHNRYQQRGGEDTTFEQESELLSQTEEVKTMIFQNHSGWKGAVQFFASVWNFLSAHRIRKQVRAFQPDIVHVHNWHYAIGPLVIRTINKLDIPVVLTVQNFRMLCPSATLLHNDKLFLDSVHAAFPWTAVRNRVYRNSFVQTFWLAFIIWVHKKAGTWNMADRYILQTDLAKSVFISSSLGTPASSFVVKPNFIRDPGVNRKEREQYFLYIGRLSREKGIDILLDVFKNSTSDLYLGGDGPLRELVKEEAGRNPHIHYLGLLDKQHVADWMDRCSALIFPSIWYEGMPLTLIEAFAAGTPVIASNLGAMSSMIRDGYNGLHFPAGHAVELSARIAHWEKLDEGQKKIFSHNARTSYEAEYTPEKNQLQLKTIYQDVVRGKVYLRSHFKKD